MLKVAEAQRESLPGSGAKEFSCWTKPYQLQTNNRFHN